MLEQKVLERTDEMERANKELEAFSYSISHDLRAPLRSIIGYSQIQLEDYGDKMDDEGRRVCNVIINNGKRMGQLIDDLLDFSRLGRKELQRGMVDMNGLVREVLQELTSRENGRKLDLRVLPLEPNKADRNMLNQVWVNLISNALKYSRKKEITVIEIGSRKEEGRTCYYINDNGAGFDMLYVDKLFGVFQRLHKMNEFEGTGVGLALVKRIVERHGGVVWAESAIDQGAKFYFTLPNN
jgi:light-regulated signal transduction histidine kinase (bacteriophytochrome)